MTGWPATRRRVLGALATGLAAGVVGAAVVVHVGRASRVTSWAAASDAVAVVGLVAALALVAAGGLTLLRSSAPGGAACLLLAVGWVSPVLVGWEGGDPALRAVATIGPALVVPLLVHVAATSQGPPTRAVRLLVAVGYLLIGGLAVVVATVRNPIDDVDSWSNLSRLRLPGGGG